MGEDAHLEAQYEDRTHLPDEDLSIEPYARRQLCDGCELDIEECECVCQRCERPGSLYDGEFYIGNEVVCWPCKDAHDNAKDKTIEYGPDGWPLTTGCPAMPEEEE